MRDADDSAGGENEMTCAEAERHFLAREQGEPTPAGFVEHLESCHACRQALEAFSHAGRALRQLPQVTVDPGLAGAIAARTRIAGPRPALFRPVVASMLAAAAVLAIVAVGLRTYGVGRSASERVPVASAPRTVAVEPSRDPEKSPLPSTPDAEVTLPGTPPVAGPITETREPEADRLASKEDGGGDATATMTPVASAPATAGVRAEESAVTRSAKAATGEGYGSAGAARPPAAPGGAAGPPGPSGPPGLAGPRGGNHERSVAHAGDTTGRNTADGMGNSADEMPSTRGGGLGGSAGSGVGATGGAGGGGLFAKPADQAATTEPEPAAPTMGGRVSATVEVRYEFCFERTPVADAIDEVAKTTGSRVDIQADLAGRPLITRSLKDVTAKDALQQICRISGLSVRSRSDGSYVVRERRQPLHLTSP
jgi:hypothetical protein